MKSTAKRITMRLLRNFGFQDGPPFQQTWDNLREMLVEPPLLRLPEAQGEFFVDPRSDNFARLIAFGCYEPELIALARHHLVQNRDAIDIGANIGIFTNVLSRGSSGGRVLACEPTPNALKLLRRNIAHNLLDNVIVFPGVVSSVQGQCELSLVEGKEEYSSIGSIFHEKVKGLQTSNLLVDSQTVDNLVETHGLKPCLLKIDVEGSEADVLKGATNTLQTFRPVIVSELSEKLLAGKGSSKEEVVKFLESHGYHVTVPGIVGANAEDPRYEEIVAVPQ